MLLSREEQCWCAHEVESLLWDLRFPEAPESRPWPLLSPCGERGKGCSAQSPQAVPSTVSLYPIPCPPGLSGGGTQSQLQGSGPHGSLWGSPQLRAPPKSLHVRSTGAGARDKPSPAGPGIAVMSATPPSAGAAGAIPLCEGVATRPAQLYGDPRPHRDTVEDGERKDLSLACLEVCSPLQMGEGGSRIVEVTGKAYFH